MKFHSSTLVGYFVVAAHRSADGVFCFILSVLGLKLGAGLSVAACVMFR